MSSPADRTLDTPLTPVLSHVSPSPEMGTPLTPPVDGEPANDCAAELEPVPSQIGRFNVLKRLGSGGMGVVYVAYDRDLDRKVALKVLRTAAISRTKRDKARHRLLREAQAMAQLSHPNVIAIFDVGSVEDQIFLAMEFVKGVTLTKWLRSAEGPHGPRRRGWKEVLLVFMEAGRGLAAAHKAGVIHRDFKPDNVMIDAEGRVRVGDFGLARAGRGIGPLARPDTYTEAIKGMAEKSLLDMRITRTGGMTGTPAYMAPEQYQGQATDARTDQFSFCVALYEGLYGQRPFVGDRVPVVREAVLAGRVQEVPKDTDVPAWLHRIVLRGLSVRPADRFKGMDELLDYLGERPRGHRLSRRIWLGAGLAVAFAGAAFAVHEVVAARPESPVPAGMCEAPDLGWDDARRAGLGRALAERPGGAVFAGPILAAIDRHAQELRDMYQETCRNAQADPAAADAAGPRRRACLERRRSAFAGLARALSEASGPALDRAGTALDGLPAPRDCDDPRRLAAAVPEPEEDGPRALVERLRAELDHAGAVLALGDAPRAWDIARALAADEETWLPARAEALYGRAAIERALGRAEAASRGLADALWAAEASRHDEVAADALTLQLGVECEDLGRRGEARRLWPRLSAALQRLGDDGRREASARGRYGRALLQEGDAEAARVELAAALRRGEELLGVDHPRLLPILLDLGAACQRGGRDREAASHVARAHELATARLPPEHPGRARVHVVAGDLARARSDAAAARERYDDALAIYAKIYGQDHPDMAPALVGRGLAAAAQQRWADAAGDLRRALAAWEYSLGPDHPRLVEPLTWLCAVDSALGEHAAAQGACTRALGLATRAGAPAQVALARFALAKARAAADAAAGETGPESRAQTVALARQALGEASAGGETALAAAISAWIAGQG
ncbi:serine/threonine-protein kinase [Nannocystis bainbridge]|uniref:Serine/threonine-protein kinase n=1 Tax=Nannocystis bainbridge TaxID=2995303 RepID=A0ABT5E458_9BACT|nr:serine/threonine-protein kinase [Nannocystis bainbridge]MDC0720525.1 serine/threonine-protein kinase [Nannocystis bainbridge]